MGILKTLRAAFRNGRAARQSAEAGPADPPGVPSLPIRVLPESEAPPSPDPAAPPGPDRAPAGPPSPPPPGDDPLWDALRRVVDPEVGLDIVTMGLVFDVQLDDGEATVVHTLTTRGCPMKDILTRGIRAELAALPDVDRVVPHLVWEPRWHPGMIDEPASRR